MSLFHEKGGRKALIQRRQVPTAAHSIPCIHSDELCDEMASAVVSRKKHLMQRAIEHGSSKVSVKKLLNRAAWVVLGTMVVFGIALVASSHVQGILVYLNLPYHWIIDFTSPATPMQLFPSIMGISNTKNYRLSSPIDKTELGVWHTFPTLDHLPPEKQAKASKRAVLYLHGNGESRAFPPNMHKYRMFQSHGHVISFDYRGFGDSTGWPSEEGLHNDSLAVWSWITGAHGLNIDPRNVLIYGHSLGTGVATKLARELCKKTETCPSGLILESPFTSILGIVEAFLPFQRVVNLIDAFLSHKFASLEHITHVKCRVMIIHGKRDKVIPLHLGEALYRKRAEVDSSSVRLAVIDEGGHSNLIYFDAMNQYISTFLNDLQYIQP